MLADFVDRALTLLDRRFLVGYWMPAFFLGLLLFFTAGWSFPWLGLTIADYFAMSSLRLGMVTLGLLLLVTLVAYLMRAFTRPIIRVYEGYWSWRWLQERGIRRQAKHWRALRRRRALAAEQADPRGYGHLQARLHYDFPSREARLLPTRLGNVLRAAEDYSRSRYGLDGVFWWPRLEPLLPESLLTRLEAAFMGLVALLNLATLSSLYALLLVANLPLSWGLAMLAPCSPSPSLQLTANLALSQHSPLCSGRDVLTWSWLVGAVAALVVAYVAYRAAVAQARAYGNLIRVAYDEHRFRVLDALHIPRPGTPAEEHTLWRRLTRWLYQQDLGAAREVTYTHPANADRPDGAF